MAMLGAAFGRKVYFDQDAHILYPMLNLLLIGPSGIGKSTSITRLGKPLIDALPPELRPQFIVGKASPERLHDDLVAEPHSLVFASELANFFSRTKYMEDMIPYVTQLLDYEDVIERRIRSEHLIVKEPSVSIVGGSTVEWLQGQLPDSAASGGFLARFLIVKEDHKHQRVADPKSAISDKQRLEMYEKRAQASEMFVHVVGGLTGEIKYQNPLALDAYSVWYNTQVPLTGALSPFSARAGEFVLRIAMLIALSCVRNKMTADDIESAIKMYNYATAKLQEVVVPFSPSGKLLAKVLEAVPANHPKTPQEVFRAMRNFAPAYEVQRFLDSLRASGDLSFVGGQYKRNYIAH